MSLKKGGVIIKSILFRIKKENETKGKNKSGTI